MCLQTLLFYLNRSFHVVLGFTHAKCNFADFANVSVGKLFNILNVRENITLRDAYIHVAGARARSLPIPPPRRRRVLVVIMFYKRWLNIVYVYIHVRYTYINTYTGAVVHTLNVSRK